MESYTEWMEKRTSWRTYKNEKLEEKDRKLIEEYIAETHVTPFGNKPRFKLVDNFSEDGKIGTYGFIRGAQHYIVGAVRKSPMSIEDLGYLFEKIILYATGLGLGTCWLGGTFTRKPVFEKMGLSEDEIIPAISPVGYKSDRGLVGKAIRWTAGSRNRKPWSKLFYMDNFESPLNNGEGGVYSVGLEMVRIAPSSSNSQPWRVVLDGDSVHFYHDEKEYSILKQLDLGIAICHFDLATREQGISGVWSRESMSDTSYVATWNKL